MVASVRNVEVARAVQRNPFGDPKPRCGGGGAVAAEAAHRARNGRNVAGRGVHPADAEVESVHDVEVARAVQRNPFGGRERRRSRRAAVTEDAAYHSRAGDGRNVAGRRVHPADAVVESVRNVEVAGAVQRNPFGGPKPRCGGRAAVAPEPARPRAGDGRNVAGRGVHPADAVVESVRNVEVAGAVQRNPFGGPKPRCGGRAAVAPEPARPRAGDGRNVAGRGVHPADAVVEGVRNVEVARAVQRNPFGGPKPRCGGRATVAPEAERPRAGDGRNVPGRGVHLADAVVPSIRNVEVAGAVQRNPPRGVERRRGGRAAVTTEPCCAGDRLDYRDHVALRRQWRCGGKEKPQRDPPAQRQQAGEGQAEELEQRAKRRRWAPAGAASSF